MLSRLIYMVGAVTVVCIKERMMKEQIVPFKQVFVKDVNDEAHKAQPSVIVS